MKAISLTFLAAALLPCTAHAASRSANYVVPADSIAGAGQRQASANYAQENSLGTPGGLGAAAPIHARHGYLAQLAEPTNFVVSAAATNLDELATLQCTAAARLDDGSWLAVTATGARWTAAAGPISIASASGLATGLAVYQDTPAQAQAQYLDRAGTFSLLVGDALPDNFGGYAGDGLNDSWQIAHFGLNSPNASPGADPDQDGQPNAYEFEVGSNPTDPNSRFVMTIHTVPGQPTQKRISVTPGLPDRQYNLQHRVSLDGGGFIPTPAILSFTQGRVDITDLAASTPHRLYRVIIVAP